MTLREEAIARRALRKSNVRRADGFNVHEDVVSGSMAKMVLSGERLSEADWRSLEDYAVKP